VTTWKEETDIPTTDRLLTVAQAAELLATGECFPRRLIAERRIRFVRVGRHVRIPESALHEFIAAGTVEPVTAWAHRRRRKVA
jgi:excisionase family DNA binding protein